MKKLLLSVVLILSASAQADGGTVVLCTVRDGARPESWPKDRLEFRPAIQEVRYFTQIPESNGTFIERERILVDSEHASQHSVKLSTCNPKIQEDSFQLTFEYTCGPFTQGGLEFQGTTGSLFVSKIRKDDGYFFMTDSFPSGDDVDRPMTFEDCQWRQ